jgi:hypothetical protein
MLRLLRATSTFAATATRKYWIRIRIAERKDPAQNAAAKWLSGARLGKFRVWILLGGRRHCNLRSRAPTLSCLVANCS